MKRSLIKCTAVLLTAVLLAALVPATASAAMAGPGAPSFTAVMRHTPRTLFPVPGSSTLVVTDGKTGLPVAGVRYELYRVGQYAGQDTLIKSVVTDKDGKAVVSHTSTGKFYWAAASKAEGYAADTEKHAFSIVGAASAVTEVTLSKPVVEAEADGYVPYNLEKVTALAAYVDENGRYVEGEHPFYRISAYYRPDDDLLMEVDLVHYVEDDTLDIVTGRALFDETAEDDGMEFMSLLTLTGSRERVLRYYEGDSVFSMTVDAKTYPFILSSDDTNVWDDAYADLTAVDDNGEEADEDLRNIMILELNNLLFDLNGALGFWGLDITLDDFGFINHK